MTVCSRPADGLRCRQGVNPPLKLKLEPSISKAKMYICLLQKFACVLDKPLQGATLSAALFLILQSLTGPFLYDTSVFDFCGRVKMLTKFSTIIKLAFTKGGGK